MSDLEIISRSDALKQGLKFFFVGQACKKGHIDRRLVSNYGCYTCHKEKYYAFIKTEEGRTLRKKQAKRDYASNKERYFLNNAKRRAASKLATPDWLSAEDIQKMKELYKNRPKGQHVDHIAPLKGKDVCGLNVPWNLQYLPACVNLSKSNT